MFEDVLRTLEWFDLNKYEEFISKLNYEQWVLLLTRRSRFWNLESEISPDGMSEIHYRNHVKFNEWEKENRDVFIQGLLNGVEYDFNVLLDSMPDYYRELPNTVTAISLPHLHFLADNYRIDGLTTQDYVSEVTKNNPKYTKGDGFSEIVYVEMNVGTSLLVDIDLLATDDVIYESLKKELEYARKKRNISNTKCFSDADLNKFKKLRLLQYIDLMIFFQAKGIRVNNVVLSKILYPDEYVTNPIERIRKTMPELARNVLSDKVLCASEHRSSLL